MILLFDIGNTHTHLGIANRQRVLRQVNIATSNWFNGAAEKLVLRFIRDAKLEGAALCSVVPRATPFVHSLCNKIWKIQCLELTAKTVSGVGIDYPKPETIGPDRLANAIAARHHFGAPSVVAQPLATLPVGFSPRAVLQNLCSGREHRDRRTRA